MFVRYIFAVSCTTLLFSLGLSLSVVDFGISLFLTADRIRWLIWVNV